MSKQKPDPEDIALFRQQMKGVKPLDQNIVETPRPRQRRRIPARPHHDPDSFSSSDPDPPGFVPESVDISEEEFIEFRRPGLQDRLYRKFQRGQIPVTAELDLHGMTSARAGMALDRFMEQIRGAGRQQCVRIIHGKGYGSKDKIPVIKRQTQIWLQCNINVLAYCSCRPADGGTGAVYVLVKNSY